VNHFGFTGRNPNIYRINGVSSEDYYTILANGGTPVSFASEPSFFFKAASMEALRCLIENDAAGGEKLARAVVRTIQIEQARRSVADTPATPPKPSTPRANCSSLGLVYDFAYNFMSPAQQDFVRQELVLLSAWADNYGTFNNAEASRSNWATFSYWVFDLMAIEGEPGFNDLKFLGLYRGWRNYFTYSFFDSGAAFEAEGKLPLGFDAMMAFDRVGWKYGLAPLSHHPMVRAYYSKFLPFSVLPARNNQFAIFDILGSLGGALTTPADLVAAKFLYPNDKLVDFSYRSLVKDNYRNLPSAIHFHWNEQAVSAITATSYDPANDPVSLNTPLSFFCGQRAMMMTRSSWDTDASFLTMHVRGASGGHPYPDRNGIMFAGKGRSWLTIPGKDIGGWAMNTVLIDEAQQSVSTPARVVDYVDQPLATFMVGDAKYSWDWVWGTSTQDKQGGSISRDDVLNANVNTGASGWNLVDQCFNDFAYDQSSRPVYDDPLKFRASWIEKDGILEPYKRMVNTPVLKSFRSAGLVRGSRPYALVVDDIQRDSMSASYEWNATLPADVVQVTSSLGQAGDVILVGSASLNPDGSLKSNEPALLIRVLTAKGQMAVPSLVTRGGFKHFQIRTTATAPDFKMLIHAFRMGETLPTTTWNSGNTTLTVGFPTQSDTISFAPVASGKTDIVVSRGGSALASINRPVVPLVDPASDALASSLQGIQARVSQLRTQNYDPKTQSGFRAGWEFGGTQQVVGIGPAYLPVAGSIAAAAPIPAGNSTLVPGMEGGLAASLAARGLATPLSWNSQIRNAFTIAFWMKMNAIENDKVYFNFGDHRTLGIRQRNGGLNLFALNDWYRDAGPSSMMTSWTHLVSVFTGSQLHIYRNGILVSSFNATPSNFNAFLNMQIGATTGTNGAVRSVHFYNRGFSAPEIQDLYLWGKFGLSAEVTPPLSPLEHWRQSHFGTTADTGNAADLFDYDGDGLFNLLEYALGGDPTRTEDAPKPAMTLSDVPPQIMYYSFMRLRSDLTYTVEGSPDLKSWAPIDTNPGNIGEMVTVETPASDDRRFIRLRVNRSLQAQD
jgi:hypothetical protein